MNEYDSNRIFDLTKKIKYERTKDLNEANCYILNTCHIREKATDKVYHDIGRLKKIFKNKPKPIVLITGCVAQAESNLLLKNEKYIDGVLGPQSYHQINKTILRLEKKKLPINITEFDVIEKFDSLNSLKNTDNKVSSFLTIQEGCDKFCKFCVVPYTRGAEYSRSIKELVLETNQLVENGAREIILLGQNVNAYNFEKNKLSDLIQEISKIKDLKRIRYTTSHPKDFTDDLIDAHKNCKKLMPLIHLPVQSGSNKILEAMNRKHTVEEYLEILKKLIKVKPEIKFSSDFIIGYPGETNVDFKNTIKLLKQVGFINSYSFKFSPRPGTPAFDLTRVDDGEAKNRLLEFQRMAEDIKNSYRKKLINKTVSVLFENKVKIGNRYFGRDEHFNPVIVESDDDLAGTIKNVKIINGNKNTSYGKIVLNLSQTNCAA